MIDRVQRGGTLKIGMAAIELNFPDSIYVSVRRIPVIPHFGNIYLFIQVLCFVFQVPCPVFSPFGMSIGFIVNTIQYMTIRKTDFNYFIYKFMLVFQ